MRRPVLLIFTKNTCNIFFLQISYINMGYGYSCNAISFECTYSQERLH